MATPRARIDASTRATPTPSSQAARTPSSNTMGRLELVSWLNHALRSDYASVQECGDGVAYCQLLDALHPGAVPLHRLDFNARYLADNERNVRVLSQTMRSLGLPVDVDYEALASGKFIENNNLLRWFHSYVAKNGMGALEAYDAYAARVRAQRVKAHASVRRRGEAAPAPAKKSGDETNGTKKTPPTTTSAERATMSERLMPNELSAMDEMARDDANEGANEGDESFEFAAPAAEDRAPPTPRALNFPETPTSTTTTTRGDARLDDAPSPFTSPATTDERPRGARSLDRWAAKARAKLAAESKAAERAADADVPPSPSIVQAPLPSPNPVSTPSVVETVEEETTSCFGCFSKRRVVKTSRADDGARDARPPPRRPSSTPLAL